MGLGIGTFLKQGGQPESVTLGKALLSLGPWCPLLMGDSLWSVGSESTMQEIDTESHPQKWTQELQSVISAILYWSKLISNLAQNVFTKQK